jgi:hypothetical protein
MRSKFTNPGKEEIRVRMQEVLDETTKVSTGDHAIREYNCQREYKSASEAGEHEKVETAMHVGSGL